MKIIVPSTELINRMIWVLYGPAGAGKTTTAFTLCKKWPKNLLVNKKPILLDDVIYWQWDSDGAICLAPFKIQIKHVINMSALIAEYGFPKALRLGCEESSKLARSDPKILAEIHDTVTTFDKFSLTYIERHAKDLNNTQAIFGQHLANHRFYSTETMARPARVSTVYLFHERVIDEARLAKASKAERAKIRAKTLADTTINIVPATTGSGGEFYTNAVSQELSVVATPIPGKPGQYNRALYPLSHSGRRAKSRFQHLLTSKMPCDLKQLRAKIQAACR